MSLNSLFFFEQRMRGAYNRNNNLSNSQLRKYHMLNIFQVDDNVARAK